MKEKQGLVKDYVLYYTNKESWKKFKSFWVYKLNPSCNISSTLSISLVEMAVIDTDFEEYYPLLHLCISYIYYTYSLL